jgi:hypothetical protein
VLKTPTLGERSHMRTHRYNGRASLPTQEMIMRTCRFLILIAIALCSPSARGQMPTVVDTDEQIVLGTPQLEATVRKRGYVSGIAGGSLLDKSTGFRDAGFGLDIVDWIMEPGSDEAYRDQLPTEMVYRFGNAYHGKSPKRSIEGPQICTQAKQVNPEIIRGDDFLGVQTSFQYKTAAPGKKTGSKWSQTIVFPVGKRYFVSSDRIDSVNDSEAMFLRIDMPGHIKHKQGDTFSQVYLSYLSETDQRSEFPEGLIPANAFTKDFAPDEKFNYRRDRAAHVPQRFIRAYRLRDPKSNKEGPWLAGMTLEPSSVSEAWCHQRGYVCMIEEFGGRPIKAGGSFSAAFVVGFFDSIEDMHKVYDQYAGSTRLDVTPTEWSLEK